MVVPTVLPHWLAISHLRVKELVIRPHGEEPAVLLLLRLELVEESF